MKHLLVAFFLSCAVCGCKPADDANSGINAPVTPPVANKAATAPVGGSGVAPMASGAAGGMTPMSGTDSVQGAGGGSTSMAAKGWAKDKINNMPSSSAGQSPAEEGN